MPRIYKQIIILSISVISIIVLFNQCQPKEDKQKWTPKVESELYDLFYKESATYTSNLKVRKEYADCCLENAKKLFPDGFSNSAINASDSLKIVAKKMGTDCAKIIEKTINVWNDETKKQFGRQLNAMVESKMLPKVMRKEYVDCVIAEVSAKYPKGFADSNATDVTKIRKNCINVVTSKYLKMKTYK